MEWEAYWQNLLAEKKLNNKVKELDRYEEIILKHAPRTEKICRGIYERYDAMQKRLEAVKLDCITEFNAIEGVYLKSGRVKGKDSLLRKVIDKRQENIAAFDSKYYNLDEFNYDKIITDLVGIRLIINYRGKWIDIHRKILGNFPLFDKELYVENPLLEHRAGEKFQAEWPIVYYAQNDPIQEYRDEGLCVKLKEIGYRGIHYILSYEETYIEIQLRTIYDEAWSECDHNYVYKKDENRSHDALVQLSEILNRLTHLSDILNDTMKSVHDKEGIVFSQQENVWTALSEHIDSIDEIIAKLEETDGIFRKFRNQLVDQQED
ncbi:MAG: hypothetical protein NC341_04660 [Blautia sp.]|nr:hypothetical protein [Blautia sp.]MCM1200929.1 hypothetical protein [Bacteroides fragilis]